MASLIPGKVCVVPEIPDCIFCDQQGERTPGIYDFATRMGPWANGCEMHWRIYRAAPGLGTGKAQLWVTEDQVDRDKRTILLDGIDLWDSVLRFARDSGETWTIETAAKLPPARFLDSDN